MKYSISNQCIFLCDFNVDTISYVRSVAGIAFTEIFSCLGNDSFIIIPTRKTSSLAICVDLIYIKLTSCIKSIALGMDVPHHETIFSCLKNDRPISHLKSIKFRDHSSHSVDSFQQHISESLESFNVFYSFEIDDKFELLSKLMHTS